MFERIKHWFAHYEPTSAETLLLIKEAITHLSPEHLAELKTLVAEIEVVAIELKPVVDVVVAAEPPTVS